MSGSRFRLVAVDLDGTLLSSTRLIADIDKRALADCVARGIAVAIVTGRRLPSARSFVDELPIDPFVVANSGAMVQNDRDRQLLRRRLLPREDAEAVLDIAARAGVEPVVHDGPEGEGLLILREGAKALPHVGRYLYRTSPRPIWVPSIELERDPVQIGFAAGLSAIRDLGERITTELSSRVSVVKTEYPTEDLALLDVLAAGASKSEGLKFLSAYLDVPMGETLAIGDNWNDVDMLEAAGLGVVMANAVEELKQKGFAETASNDASGVAQALKRYVL